MKFVIKEKHVPPSKLVEEQQGTIYKVAVDEHKNDYYVQLDNDKINWVLFDTILIDVFKRFYDNNKFIEELILLYHDKDRSIKDLLNLLK